MVSIKDLILLFANLHLDKVEIESRQELCKTYHIIRQTRKIALQYYVEFYDPFKIKNKALGSIPLELFHMTMRVSLFQLILSYDELTKKLIFKYVHYLTKDELEVYKSLLLYFQRFAESFDMEYSKINEIYPASANFILLPEENT